MASLLLTAAIMEASFFMAPENSFFMAPENHPKYVMFMGKKWLWRDHNLEMYWLSDFQLEHTYIYIYPIWMSYKNLYSLYLCCNYFQKLSILRWNRCKHHHHDSSFHKRLHFSPKEADPPDTTSCSHESLNLHESLVNLTNKGMYIHYTYT